MSRSKNIPQDRKIFAKNEQQQSMQVPCHCLCLGTGRVSVGGMNEIATYRGHDMEAAVFKDGRV